VTLGSWLATIAGLPVGGVPSAFFLAFIKQPVEERWKEWAESVIERLIEVEYKVEDLKNNKSFISAFMQASQIVFQTHQQAKLDALRSAVVNMASPLFANDNIYFMFISWIQIFVPWHLRILKYMELEQISAKHGGTGEVTGPLAMRIKNSFPAQEYDFDLSKQCFEDLRNRGLINVDTLTHEIEGEMVATAKITNFGKKFIEFITD